MRTNVQYVITISQQEYLDCLEPKDTAIALGFLLGRAGKITTQEAYAAKEKAARKAFKK